MHSATDTLNRMGQTARFSQSSCGTVTVQPANGGGNGGNGDTGDGGNGTQPGGGGGGLPGGLSTPSLALLGGLGLLYLRSRR